MQMFQDMADELFAAHGVSKEKNRDIWQQCVDILSSKMAMLSVMYGLSRERVDLWKQQKDSLGADLDRMKATGELVQ